MSKRAFTAIVWAISLALVALLVFTQEPAPAIPSGEAEQPATSGPEKLAATPIESEPLRSVVPKSEPVSMLFVVQDAEAQPLEGAWIAEVIADSTERAIPLDQTPLLGRTDESGRLTAPASQGGSVRFYAHDDARGSARFVRHKDHWLARYPISNELSILCRTTDGIRVPGVSAFFVKKTLAQRHLALALDSEATLSLLDDEHKIYKGRADYEGMIRLRLPPGDYWFNLSAPGWAYVAGPDPDVQLATPGDLVTAVFTPIYGLVYSWPRSASGWWGPAAPARLGRTTRHNRFSLERETKRLQKEHPGKIVQCFAPRLPIEPSELKITFNASWKPEGQQECELEVERVLDGLRVQDLGDANDSPKLPPATPAKLKVTLVDPRGNEVRGVKLTAYYLNDSSAPGGVWSPSNGSIYSLESGTESETPPGVYLLSSKQRVVARAFDGARVTLAAGETKGVQFATEEILRPVRVVSDGIKDAPNVYMAILDQDGNELINYMGQPKKTLPLYLLPPGVVTIVIRVVKKIVFDGSFEVVYDPLYTEQAIELPGEVFRDWKP